VSPTLENAVKESAIRTLKELAPDFNTTIEDIDDADYYKDTFIKNSESYNLDNDLFSATLNLENNEGHILNSMPDQSVTLDNIDKIAITNLIFKQNLIEL